MFKNSLYLIAIAIGISACGTDKQDQRFQSGPVTQKVHKLHYSNSNGEKGVTEFYYDANGIRHRANWKLVDGTRSSENYYTYDRKGNLTLKYREFSDGLISWQRYEYDDQSKLTSRHFERSDSVKGTTTYQYNDTGRLIGADCQGLNGWFFGRLFYEYDSTGHKSGALIKKDNKQIGTIVYSYNENGKLVREVWKFNTGFEQTFEHEYKDYRFAKPKIPTSPNVYFKNVDQFRIVEEYWEFDENSGQSYYTYDQNGKLTKKIFERSDDVRTETIYEYDNNNVLKTAIRKYNEKLFANLDYVYDGNRRLVARYFERSDGVVGRDEYEYDEKGRLIKAKYDNFDSWLTGTIRYSHDENGFLDKAKFKGKTFNADIDVETDAFGNVVMVKWDFTFGKTQTYTFEYDEIE